MSLKFCEPQVPPHLQLTSGFAALVNPTYALRYTVIMRPTLGRGHPTLLPVVALLFQLEDNKSHRKKKGAPRFGVVLLLREGQQKVGTTGHPPPTPHPPSLFQSPPTPPTGPSSRRGCASRPGARAPRGSRSVSAWPSRGGAAEGARVARSGAGGLS